MDESVQREKINAAIGDLRRAVTLHGPVAPALSRAACQLLDVLPVEGWPEQLPAMSGEQIADALRLGLTVEVRHPRMGWNALIPQDLSVACRSWADRASLTVARVVPAPTRTIRADAVEQGMTWRDPDGRWARVNDVRPAMVDISSRCVGYELPPDALVEVLDTETGAPE